MFLLLNVCYGWHLDQVSDWAEAAGCADLPGAWHVSSRGSLLLCVREGSSH